MCLAPGSRAGLLRPGQNGVGIRQVRRVRRLPQPVGRAVGHDPSGVQDDHAIRPFDLVDEVRGPQDRDAGLVRDVAQASSPSCWLLSFS